MHDNFSRFQNLNKSFVGQIIKNPLPDLYSMGTPIQGTLSSVLWVSPE